MGTPNHLPKEPFRINRKMVRTFLKVLKGVDPLTWQLIHDGKTPGYRSCVQYIPGSEANGIIATGIPGISYSLNGGKSWQGLDHEYYYTIRFASEKIAWLAGKDKIARMEW